MPSEKSVPAVHWPCPRPSSQTLLSTKTTRTKVAHYFIIFIIFYSIIPDFLFFFFLRRCERARTHCDLLVCYSQVWEWRPSRSFNSFVKSILHCSVKRTRLGYLECIFSTDCIDSIMAWTPFLVLCLSCTCGVCCLCCVLMQGRPGDAHDPNSKPLEYGEQHPQDFVPGAEVCSISPSPSLSLSHIILHSSIL
jgi:hypothetical protein